VGELALRVEERDAAVGSVRGHHRIPGDRAQKLDVGELPRALAAASARLPVAPVGAEDAQLGGLGVRDPDPARPVHVHTDHSVELSGPDGVGAADRDGGLAADLREYAWSIGGYGAARAGISGAR